MTASVPKLVISALFVILAVLLFPMKAQAAEGSSATGSWLANAETSKTIDVVKKYKADPKGKKDSRHAIQAALNYAKSESSPSNRITVYLPEGKYKISSSLKIYSNTDLLLDDKATIVKSFNAGCMIRNDNGSKGGFSGSENISIRGGTWDGNTDEYYSVATFSNIRIGHANNVLICNTSVINNINGHHIEAGGVKDLTIKNCYFSGYTGNLLKEAIQLDVMNCDEVFTGFAPFDDTSCDNVLITNCTFKNLMRGIGSHTAVAGKYYTNVTISDNTFENVSDLCIMLYNYRKCTVSGNTITDCGAGITFNYLSDESFKHFFTPIDGLESAKRNIMHDADTVISDNTISTYITAPQQWPFGIKLYGAYYKGDSYIPEGDYYISGVDIKNNVVRSSDAALKLNDVSGCTVSGNTFAASDGGNDVQLCNISACSNLDIQDNTVKDSHKCGIYVTDSSSVTVKQNSISSIEQIAVLLRASNDSKVSENSIKECTTGGIKIDESCSSVSAAKNIIKLSSGYGIKIDSCGSGTDITVNKNDLSGSDVGIYCVNNGKALLKNNSFEAVADKVKADSEGLITLIKAKNFSAEEITDNKIKLTWTAVNEADGINVYRHTAGGEYEYVASVENGSIFQDERLFSGTNYYYKLVPYIMIGDTMSGNTESDEIEARTKFNIENAYIECISQAAFTGRPVMPGFSITANSCQLIEGIDYTYEYSNNLYVGTAQITITGRGNYIGTLTYKFSIALDAPAAPANLRQPGNSMFGRTQKRSYKVVCRRTENSLLADSDERVNAAQRSIDALRLSVPIETTVTAAVWNGSGFDFY